MRTLPDKITSIQLPSGKVTVDGHGYLTDPADWNDEFVTYCAAKEQIELSPLHHDVIRFIRRYLDQHGIAADARFVLKFLEEHQGLNKTAAKQLLFELFPYGYVQQACKIAGMKQPRAWSTG